MANAPAPISNRSPRSCGPANLLRPVTVGGATSSVGLLDGRLSSRPVDLGAGHAGEVVLQGPGKQSHPGCHIAMDQSNDSTNRMDAFFRVAVAIHFCVL